MNKENNWGQEISRYIARRVRTSRWLARLFSATGLALGAANGHEIVSNGSNNNFYAGTILGLVGIGLVDRFKMFKKTDKAVHKFELSCYDAVPKDRVAGVTDLFSKQILVEEREVPAVEKPEPRSLPAFFGHLSTVAPYATYMAGSTAYRAIDSGQNDMWEETVAGGIFSAGILFLGGVAVSIGNINLVAHEEDCNRRIKVALALTNPE